MNAMIEVKQLTKSYRTQRVLNNISLQVGEGEFFGFAGINGAGKSTFLKCLLGFHHYEAGDIRINGAASNDVSARQLLSFLPERFVPPYYLTGANFIRLMLRLQNLSYDEKAVREMASAVDLSHDALGKPVRSYSKGMTQKLGLVTSFLSAKRLYVLDEPMSGLDPKARALVKKQLMILRERGVTLFFTSHMLSDIEEICTTMAILHDGEIRYHGTPAGIKESSEETLEDAYLRVIA